MVSPAATALADSLAAAKAPSDPEPLQQPKAGGPLQDPAAGPVLFPAPPISAQVPSSPARPSLLSDTPSATPTPAGGTSERTPSVGERHAPLRRLSSGPRPLAVQAETVPIGSVPPPTTLPQPRISQTTVDDGSDDDDEELPEAASRRDSVWRVPRLGGLPKVAPGVRQPLPVLSLFATFLL
jgi:hypothetical protein